MRARASCCGAAKQDEGQLPSRVVLGEGFELEVGGNAVGAGRHTHSSTKPVATSIHAVSPSLMTCATSAAAVSSAIVSPSACKVRGRSCCAFQRVDQRQDQTAAHFSRGGKKATQPLESLAKHSSPFR